MKAIRFALASLVCVCLLTVAAHAQTSAPPSEASLLSKIRNQYQFAQHEQLPGSAIQPSRVTLFIRHNGALVSASTLLMQGSDPGVTETTSSAFRGNFKVNQVEHTANTFAVDVTAVNQGDTLSWKGCVVVTPGETMQLPLGKPAWEVVMQRL